VFAKIVVGYAGDPAGRDAVRLAAELAVEQGSAVTVVFPYNPLKASATSEQEEERVRAEVQEITAGIDGLSPFTYRWTPPPWPHGLHELASYENADLMVCGAAGDGLAKHLHIGLMERMVRGAPCAVLLASPGYADDARALAPGAGRDD
jgi:nucleotide-binding universal stress UspA family protein